MAKNIVVLSDGTWFSLQNPWQTNIGLIYKYLLHTNEQQVHYDAGIGTIGGMPWADLPRNIWQGMTGKGINTNIKSLYRFICERYQPGDAIYLLGFSRGAYTVRSLVGLIRKSGILRQELISSDLIEQAFNIYRQDDTTPDTQQARAFRQNASQFDADDMLQHQPIRFLGVFDTVGDLGIPIPRYGYIDIPQFHDTELSRIVQVARHALATDEQRKGFNATLFQNVKKPSDCEQRWFIGDHSDVGGGHHIERPQDPCLANIPLVWMAQQAHATGLVINDTFFNYYQTANRMEADKQAKIHHSPSLLFPLADYHRQIGLQPDERLDSSTVWRFEHDPSYQPDNLQQYFIQQTQLVDNESSDTERETELT